MLEKIQARFKESIQIQIACGQNLPEQLNAVVQRLVACLLRGNKVIVCGTGRSYANAQLLVSHLIHRYDFPRPNFAAVLLQFDGLIASSIAQDDELHLIYKRQLQAVGKEGDLFIAFMPRGTEQAVRNALHFANDENLEIVVFAGQNDEHIQSLLDENDIEIAIPSDNEMRIIEGHQFCVNLLCELVDATLFAPPSSTEH